MLSRHKLLLAIVLTVSVTLMLIVTATPRSTSAQGDAATLRALLEQLTAESENATNKVTFSIEFAVPLVSGERGWLLPDAQRKRTVSQIGDDYVCFSESWNDATRQRCTPFTNIVSVTFTK